MAVVHISELEDRQLCERITTLKAGVRESRFVGRFTCCQPWLVQENSGTSNTLNEITKLLKMDLCLRHLEGMLPANSERFVDQQVSPLFAF